MKTLTLSLKKKWFDMIRSGEKVEEYREIKYFWKNRFIFGKYIDQCGICKIYFCNFDKLVFTLGYPKAGDTSRRLEFKNPKIRIDTGKPEWGAEPGKKYFVITWEK